MGFLSGDYMPQDIMGGLRRRRGPWQPREGIEDGQPEPDDDLDGGGGMEPAPQGTRVVSVSDGDSGGAPPTAPSTTPTYGGSNVTPYDDSRLRGLEAQATKMQQPKSLMQRLLQVGMVALPAALGGLVGGGAGAAGAAEGVNKQMQTRAKEKLTERATLNEQIEHERARQATAQGQERTIEANKPYRDLQMRNIQSAIDHRGQGTQPQPDEFERLHSNTPGHGDHKPTLQERVDYQRSIQQAPQGDEFERLHSNDPKHAGHKPTLQERIDFDNSKAKAAHQPPDPSYTPLTDDAGRIIGRWNNRSGTTESLSNKVAKDGTAAPPTPPMRRSGVPATVQRTDIQSIAVQRAQEDVEKFIDANAAKMGPVMGRGQNFLQWFGSPDPGAQELRMRVESLAALNPAIHNFRSSVWAQNMVKELGGLKMTPEALKAGIRGLTSAAKVMHESTAEYYGAGRQPQAGGTIEEWERGPDGKMRRKQ